MTLRPGSPLSRGVLILLVLCSGFATLSWEVIWQIKSTLALGISAWGTAITLAVTMGGMSIGGFLMGRALRDGMPVRALRVYGGLEFIVGVAGLFLNPAFRAVERLDSWAYAGMPGSASLVHILGIVVVLGIPTICMGATLPVFGLLAGQFEASIAKLYGLNTLGAATGCLAAALALIPLVGITGGILVTAGINFVVAAAAWLLDPGPYAAAAPAPVADAPGATHFVQGGVHCLRDRFCHLHAGDRMVPFVGGDLPGSRGHFCDDACLPVDRAGAGFEKCAAAQGEE